MFGIRPDMIRNTDFREMINVTMNPNNARRASRSNVSCGCVDGGSIFKQLHVVILLTILSRARVIEQSQNKRLQSSERVIDGSRGFVLTAWHSDADQERHASFAHGPDCRTR